MLSDRGHMPYPASSLEQLDAELLVHDYDGGPATIIPRSDWSIGRLEQGELEPDPYHISLEKGFKAGKVYQCIYTTATAPLVGLGFAGVRDLISYLRYSNNLDNPCAGDIHHTMAFGSSQSGRFLRHMLYLAMNQDEEDRMVFDGIISQGGAAASAPNGSANHPPPGKPAPAASSLSPTSTRLIRRRARPTACSNG